MVEDLIKLCESELVESSLIEISGNFYLLLEIEIRKRKVYAN